MLENMNKMLLKAKKEKYAVPQFNINNLEWTKYILEECQRLNIPVILGVSEGAAKYMGGFFVISSIVKGLIHDLDITIPVALHLDHGTSAQSCFKAIDSGFTSVMIDASKYEIEKNIVITKEVVDYAHKNDASVEAEVGHIGGEEDGIKAEVLNASIEDCVKMYKEAGIDALAPAVGSVHGFYHGEPNLDFQLMKDINEELPIPLVLHGGSGIPDYQIKEAILSGISKINVNTDLQVVWASAVREFLLDNQNAYDPRKIISSGEGAVKAKIAEIVSIFGTKNQQIEIL